MSAFTGQEHEDLVFALELLEAKIYPSFKDLPDEMANIAVGTSESEKLSSLESIKHWLRRAETEPVRWFALSPNTWETVEWILGLQADAEYSSANPDSGVVFFPGGNWCPFLIF